MDTSLKTNSLQHSRDFQILDAMIQMISVGDVIPVISNNGTFYDATVTFVNSSFVTLGGVRRLKFFRLVYDSGFDLLDGKLVYYL